MWKKMPSTCQELFDQALDHLMTQKKRCTTTELHPPTCLYRGDNGLKCAIGGVLPDELYHPKYENSEAIMLLEDIGHPKAVTKSGQLTKFAKLASDIQLVHDSSEVPAWLAKMAFLAGKYKLNTIKLNWWIGKEYGGF